jgi:uncharacterized protein YbjT (DUF2867 family)
MEILMTILITGASGTIGSALVQDLKARGVSFETMSSRPGQASRTGDFADPESLTKAFAGIDTLFVLLPLVSNKLGLASNVATAAKAAGVKHMVRSSGAGADAHSPFALPRLQGQIDDLLSATGIPTTLLRPAGFMQNYATFQAAQVIAGEIAAPHGDSKKSMVDARDIAAVVAVILLDPSKHAGKAYVLTSEVSQSEAETASVLSNVLGRPVGYQATTLQDTEAGMKHWGLPPEIQELMSSLHQIVAAGYAAGTTRDVETLLGRKPISVEQFARDYAKTWVRAA